MNSSELRFLSKKSQQEQMQKRKNKLYNDYHELIQKSHIFAERNVDKFIEYIEERVAHKAQQGEEKVRIEVLADYLGGATIAQIHGENFYWEYFFQNINNPKLVNWCQSNEIYFVVTNKKHHYSDLPFEPFQFFKKEDVYFKWVITVDFGHHSNMCNLFNALRSKNTYYIFRNKDNKSKARMLEKKARKLGLNL